MTERILSACTWELGPCRQLSSAEADWLYSFGKQDFWAGLPAGGSLQTGKNGQWAYKPATLGLSDPMYVTGHYETRTKDYICYYGYCQFNDVTDPTKLTTNDQYSVARMLTDNTGGGPLPTTFLELRARWTKGTPNSVALQVTQGNNSTGKKLSSYYAVPTNWLYWAIRIKPSDHTGEFFIANGTPWTLASVGTFTMDTGTSYPEAPPIPCTLFKGGGKGSDAGLNVIDDDFIVSEMDAGDAPVNHIQGILYQPDCNVENAWTGDYRDVDDENDSTVTGTDSLEIVPTATGDRETFRFKTEPSGTVMGVRLSFELAQMGTTHTLSAFILGAANRKEWTNPAKGYTPSPFPSVYRCFAGRQLLETPEPTPVAWTLAKFNDLRAGLQAINSSDDCGEFYAIAIGTGLTRPTATGASPGTCTTGETVPPAAVASMVIPRRINTLLRM